MTDRHAGYIVTLAEDVREDDAEAILSALRMVKGVLSVEPIVASPHDLHIATQRVRQEWRGKILDLLDEMP
ncbi:MULTISPECIES: hypothetical protein [Streptosporangiaceae]|uniref:hypothetical protein n=1 Tax=Streptosporangiaceae TaxID=2004 RepID=UPI0033D3EB47